MSKIPRKFKVEEAQIFPKNTIVISPETGLFKTGFKNPMVQLVNDQLHCYTENIVISDHIPVDTVWLGTHLMNKLQVKDEDTINILPLSRTSPDSYRAIKKRMKGFRYTPQDLVGIVNDIHKDRLNVLEKTTFVVTQLFQELDMAEIEAMTKAMSQTGEILDFGNETVFDKHSTGGVPGNKVTLLIVPIVASTGLLIPKTSSRAITSPSGTADTMESLGVDISFSGEELVEISKKTRGIIAWGGALNLSPIDDILISDVEYPLGLNPTSMMLASIMSKKVASGIHFLAMDLPTGPGTKIANEQDALALGREFAELGRRLGIQVESGVTYGATPVGHAVGPGLEAREALNTLIDPANGPSSLIEKSCELAGIIFEMSGKALRGQGRTLAQKQLHSGKALKKFREMIEAQSGNPQMRADDIKVGDHSVEMIAPSSGWIVDIDNAKIAEIAKTLGCPRDKGAGIYFIKKKEGVQRGESVLRLYSSSESRLRAGEGKYAKLNPITIEGMLLGRI